MPHPDETSVPEECWRCHERDASTLRRLTVSYLSRIEIVERVLCRACLDLIQTSVQQPLEQLLEDRR